MYKKLIHRIVIIMGFFISILSLIINLMMGKELLYSAFIALCILFAVSTVLLIAFQSVGRLLMNYLAEQKRLNEAAKQQENEEPQQNSPPNATPPPAG